MACHSESEFCRQPALKVPATAEATNAATTASRDNVEHDSLATCCLTQYAATFIA